MKNNKLLSILIIIFIISVGLCSISFFSIDPDYLWHIKVGDYIFHNGILKKDVFSWYLHGKYWMSHEWLFELFIYYLKKIFGNLHLLIYSVFCVFLLIVILFSYNKKNLFKNILFSIIWIFFFFLIIFNMQARPHLLSFSFLAITIYCLYDLFINSDSKKVFFLPIISILWSNIHGGSSNLVYILCFLFLVIGLFRFIFSKIEAQRLNNKQIIKYFSVGIICIFSVLLNIHGIKMVAYPYQNMANSVMLSNISEWRATSLSEPLHYVYYAFILFVFIIMLISKKKIRLIDFFLLLFMTYLGLKSIRFWFYSYIISSFFIFYYINKRSADKGTEICIIILSLFFLSLFIFKLNNLISPSYNYILSDEDINFIKKEKPKRLFNMYDFGGDLIYNDIEVFIDGRADFYSLYNYDDYLKILSLSKKSISLLDKYSFDYMLIDDRFSIGTYLSYSTDYSLVYSNKNIKLYKKTN